MKRMNDDRRVRTLGWLLIGGSLLINEPLIELVLVPDGEIEDPMLSAVVLGFACLGVAVGVYVLRRRPAWHLPGAAECALAAASLVLTLVFAESAARFWLRFVASESAQERYTLIHDIDGEELRYSRHHYLNYYTTPDFEKGDTRHNSLGFRGEEIAIPKPPNTFRIATLGGSTTYNYGVEDDDHTYPGRLEHHLREMGYRGVEVINAGVGGYNSFESLINLQFRVLDVEPDLVIVYQNTNDVHTRFVDPAFYRGDNFGRRRPWS
ncbi:MAG TPA: SGNH/GDSL hydrolase family protein, partial [Myxococcota bacterium]|nr:SGNH/GDSL hydrolase family protein [Myxococcota bacterium]